MKYPIRLLCCLLALGAGLISLFAIAQEKKEAKPPAPPAKSANLKPGVFPAGSGTYLSGELVVIDPVNRRGGLRLDGNPNERYHDGPLHYFALLPYGMVWFNGAPAELRDISLGTHVHGYFHAPPAGEEQTIPPLPKEQAKFAIEQNHAVSLEDDFSFYQRQGQSWKVVAVDLEKGKLQVESTGKAATDGITGKYTFDIDAVTRVWKGRTLVDLKEIAPEQVVQFNLAWSQGWRDKEFAVSDLWLDAGEPDVRHGAAAAAPRPLPEAAVAPRLDRQRRAQRFRRRRRHAHAVRRNGCLALRGTEGHPGQGLWGGDC